VKKRTEHLNTSVIPKSSVASSRDEPVGTEKRYDLIGGDRPREGAGERIGARPVTFDKAV
jgi:hypothetical protein